MTTTTDKQTKKVAKTSKGVAYKTIQNHIKTQVFGISEYDVIADLDDCGSHLIVTPKEGNTIYCIDELVTIANAYKAHHYVWFNDIRGRIEFVIY